MINHDIPSPISPMNLCLRYNWLLSHVSNEVIATPGRVMFDVWLRDGAIISTGLSPWIIDKSMIMVTCYKIWIPLYFSGYEGFWLHSKCQQGARTSGLANVCKKNTSWNPRALDGPIAGSCCIDVQEWGITYSSWLSCIRQLMMSIIHGHFDEDSVRFRNGKTYFPWKKRHLLTASKCVSFEAMLGSYHDLWGLKFIGPFNTLIRWLRHDPGGLRLGNQLQHINIPSGYLT